MNNSNEVSFHFIYLIQAPTPSLPYSFSLWVLNNTNSITSVFSGIILGLLVLSIIVKANIYANNKILMTKLLTRKAKNLRYIESLFEDLEKLKLSSVDRENFRSIIITSEKLRSSIEELKIEDIEKR